MNNPNWNGGKLPDQAAQDFGNKMRRLGGVNPNPAPHMGGRGGQQMAGRQPFNGTYRQTGLGNTGMFTPKPQDITPHGPPGGGPGGPPMDDPGPKPNAMPIPDPKFPLGLGGNDPNAGIHWGPASTDPNGGGTIFGSPKAGGQLGGGPIPPGPADGGWGLIPDLAVGGPYNPYGTKPSGITPPGPAGGGYITDPMTGKQTPPWAVPGYYGLQPSAPSFGSGQWGFTPPGPAGQSLGPVEGNFQRGGGSGPGRFWMNTPDNEQPKIPFENY